MTPHCFPALRAVAAPAALALAALCATGCGDRADQARIVGNQLRSCDKLVLSQMAITKMASIADWDLDSARGPRQVAAAVADMMKIGSRKAAYSYRTYLRAYVDLSALRPGDVRVDPGAKTITVDLPPVQTEFAGRDAEIREEHYRVSGLRSGVDASERAEIKERMNAELVREVSEDPRFRDMVTASAQAKGRDFVRSLAARDGYQVVVNYK